MKQLRQSLAVAAVLILAGLSAGMAMDGMSPKPASSKEFERMKALVGTWKGKSEMDKNQEEVTIEYRLTAGDSVVVETISPGDPKHEMITTYYDQGGKLAMTHYCSMGNRPEMTLNKADDKTLEFLMDKKANGIDPKKDGHMHALKLTFVDKDHLNADWTMFMDGKSSHKAAFALTRVAADAAQAPKDMKDAAAAPATDAKTK